MTGEYALAAERSRGQSLWNPKRSGSRQKVMVELQTNGARRTRACSRHPETRSEPLFALKGRVPRGGNGNARRGAAAEAQDVMLHPTNRPIDLEQPMVQPLTVSSRDFSGTEFDSATSSTTMKQYPFMACTGHYSLAGFQTERMTRLQFACEDCPEKPDCGLRGADTTTRPVS